MKFKTMASLTVLTTVAFGNQAGAVFDGPFGEEFRANLKIYSSFKEADLKAVGSKFPDRDKSSLQATLENVKSCVVNSRARGLIRIPLNESIIKALKNDPKAVFQFHYVHRRSDAYSRYAQQITEPLSDTISEHEQRSMKARLLLIDSFNGSTSFEDHLINVVMMDRNLISKLLMVLTYRGYIQGLFDNLKQERVAFLLANSEHGLDDLTVAAAPAPTSTDIGKAEAGPSDAASTTTPTAEVESGEKAVRLQKAARFVAAENEKQVLSIEINEFNANLRKLMKNLENDTHSIAHYQRNLDTLNGALHGLDETQARIQQMQDELAALDTYIYEGHQAYAIGQAEIDALPPVTDPADVSAQAAKREAIQSNMWENGCLVVQAGEEKKKALSDKLSALTSTLPNRAKFENEHQKLTATIQWFKDEGANHNAMIEALKSQIQVRKQRIAELQIAIDDFS